MGLKQLRWSSVQIPMIMPKPDFTSITGGYRKTPVLQIGADIYCDTSLIARELESRFPTPTLFPDAMCGLGFALGQWSDKAFFQSGAALSMGENKEIPEPVLTDRKAFFNFMDFDNMAAEMPNCYAQFLAHCQLLDDEIKDLSTDFLAGDAASWVDIQAYFPVWMALGNIPRAKELLTPFVAILNWAECISNIGHGQRSELEGQVALTIARDSEPANSGTVSASAFHDFGAGDAVTVTPDDYGNVPVAGTLRSLSNYRITITRSDANLGTTAVHFPRVGYVIEHA